MEIRANLTGDGQDGAPGHGVFDRSWSPRARGIVPPAWTAQPRRAGGSWSHCGGGAETRCAAFVHEPDGVLRCDGLTLYGFIPLTGPDGERRALLDDDGVGLVWDIDQPVDPARLAGVLDEPGVICWSGVCVGPQEPIDGAWLRLAVEEPGAVGLRAARPRASRLQGWWRWTHSTTARTDGAGSTSVSSRS